MAKIIPTNTELEFDSNIMEYFEIMLPNIGVGITEASINDFTMVFKNMLIMIKMLKRKCSNSQSVNRQIKKLANDFDLELTNEGGDLDVLLGQFRRQIKESTGVIGVNALMVYKEPEKFYSLYCKSTSVRRRFLNMLFTFYEKHAKRAPRIRQDRTVNHSGVYFDQFFELCESALSDLCGVNVHGLNYEAMKNLDSLNYFLKREYSLYKHQRAGVK